MGEGAELSGNKANAQRIYLVAEDRYAAGDFEEAVSLMRHALLQLPTTSENDALRHKLVLRIGHTQLRDFATTGQVAPLYDAQQMLTRYLERHEGLFGETEKALLERGEVYELLHEVEKRLEPVAAGEATQLAQVTAMDGAATGEPLAAEPPSSPDRLDGATNDATVETATTNPALRAVDVPREFDELPGIVIPDAKVPDDHADGHRASSHRGFKDGETRKVVVPKANVPSVDDPAVREKLRSRYTTPWVDMVLTAPGIDKIHDARPLVRGSSRLAGEGDSLDRQLARRAGQFLLRDARPSLRECYADAYARQPISALESTVEASIHPDGTVSHVRIVSGGLVDGRGDACVIEAMEGASVPVADEISEPVRVQVAMTFFYQRAHYIVNTSGEIFPEGGIILRPNPPRRDGLPPIEKFNRFDPHRAPRSSRY